MIEKTIEELQAELESLKKANLEKEIADEQKKIDAVRTLEIEKEKELERETMREELLAELGDKSKVQTTTEKPTMVAGVINSTTTNLTGGEKTNLVMLKKAVGHKRAATYGTDRGALPLDLSETDAYRAPSDDMDYYSRVRWLRAGGKKAQLKAIQKANRTPGVI